MTTRTWTGEVSNDASNGDNWSPAGAPQPGDTLTDMLNGSTIDIKGNTLSGAPLTVLSPKAGVSATLNLTDAQVNLTEQPPSKGR